MILFTDLYIVIGIVLLSLIFNIFKISRRNRNIIITLFSLVVLGTMHLAFVAIILIVVATLYLLTKFATDKKLGLTAFTLIGLAIAFIVLMLGKYGDTLIYILFRKNYIFGFPFLAPLGISYFVMKAIQFVIDYRRGTIKDVKFLDIIAFISFLPTFAAGPIESYNSFKNAYIQDYKVADYVYGVKRITLGYFKKVVVTDMIIAYYFTNILEYLGGIESAYIALLMPLLRVIITFVKAYFDLSAYSDLAIGYSRLLGFKIIENFNKPFWKRNISQFWRSWHISLSSWCTSNVYFPVFGATRKIWLGMYASMITMGMWHHVSLNWLAWALHHATGLVLFSKFDKYARKHKKLKKFMNTKVMRFCSHILTFLYVSFGYAFVANSNLSEGWYAYTSAIMAIPKIIYTAILSIF